MRRALRLARKGIGKTSPNPMVGALIVKNGEIMGQGYHRYYGGNHAEINAIQDAKGEVDGATLYVTLEPCCHSEKKTPPCVDAIIKSNVERAIIGMIDPNPLVNGKCIEILKQQGIETKVGVLENECYKLNEIYCKYIQTQIPFITLKFAQTLDGRIASVSGSSQWISSEPSRKLAHKLRSIHDGILVGINTVLVDDPQLTVRLVKGKNPVRIILDSKLRIPLGSKILKEQNLAVTIVATTPQANERKLTCLKEMGIETLVVQEDEEGKIYLLDLLKKLGKRNISSILVEGGAKVITSFLRQGLADKIIVAIGPKIMGRGIEAVGDLGISNINHALKLSSMKTHRRGEDLIIEANIVK
jgi:diaminohydroxyphosphoribosylaminopyrimidine deaminase/5-amino-6-(5-phosphoribosylamino)uracil reductase